MTRIVEKAQREAVRALGLPPALAAIGHREQFAQIFQLTVCRRAMVSRWPGKLPRGAAGLLDEATGAAIGVTAGSIRRLKGWIKQLIAGTLSTIPGSGSDRTGA